MHSDKQKIIKDKTLPKSIRSVVRMYPSNQVNRLIYGGLPHLGNALLGFWSSPEIQEAATAYENYSLSSNLLIKGFKSPILDKVRLGGGSPARFKPFNRCLTNIRHSLENRVLSDYPLAAGDNVDKAPIIKYFRKLYSMKIDENNIIFTHSSTQAFTLVMEAILDYGDVVIITAPNYGLFSFMPERAGGQVRLLQLTSLDGWKVDPKKLKRLIVEVNNELESDYDTNRGKYIFRRSDLPPRVSVFVNLNPHNPTGMVYSQTDKSLLLEISSVCKERGVFIIDDLAYAGLEYDRNNPALPICSLSGHFDNTITLYSLSKSYGLASIRSGMVVANEIISSLIRDKIFQVSDSLSLVQSSAMSAIFSSDETLAKEREVYLARVAKEYYQRYIFVKAIIVGADNLRKKEKTLLDKIIIDNRINIDSAESMNGIRGVSIALEPEAGFFIILDLSKLLGKSYEGFRIIDDKTMSQFLYTSGNIKILPGKAFCWSDRNQLVVRATTAMEYKDLFKSFWRFKTSIELLA
ncbi:MAG: pyridoxal phosphate-dependent aminotransferase [Patescibacteria group bacterium]